MKKNNIKKGVCRISSSIPIPLPSFPESRSPNSDSRSRGVIMVMVGFLLVIIAALVLGMLQLRAGEIQALGNKMRQAGAQYIADAGIEQAIWYLRMYKQPMWEWGDPNYTGVVTNARNSAFALTATGKCWGTRLNDNYPNGIYYQEKLVTPEITVSVAAPRLCYCYTLNNDENGNSINDDDDDAQILLTTNNGLSWTSLGALANEWDTASAWASTSNTLSSVVAGANIRIAFSLYTDSNLNRAGWYIDNVSVVPAAVGCPADACTTAPTTPYFYDDMENGIGSWEYWIEPNQNTTLPINCPSSCSGCCDNSSYPNDYPANSGNYYWIGFDPRFAASSEWLIFGRGVYQNYSRKVEAKVSVHGGSAPYNVKIQYWKRIM